MDAIRLFGVLRPILDDAGARWMLAGGHAMAAWGSDRTTFDVDLLVDEGARGPLLEHVTAAGFELYNDAPGFSNLEHPDRSLGRLDFLWVEGETTRRLFESSVERIGPDGLLVRVPKLEHLVALKVRAIQGRPTRVLRDGPDLVFLLSRPGLDENEARGFFEKAGLLELWDRFRGGT